MNLNRTDRLLWQVLRCVALCISLASPLVAENDEFEYFIGYMGVGGTSTEIAHVIGLIRPDGTGEYYPELKEPNQRSWVFGPIFSDGARMILASYEETNITNVRAGKSITHDWIFDLTSGKVTPVLEKERQADQLRPYILLPGDQRVIETAIMGGEERIFIKDLDGGNPVELTSAGSGFHYALELSHDQTRLACHVAGGGLKEFNPGVYSINVFDLATGKRTFIGGQPEHLMFGPHWSPDDTRLVYLDCHAAKDPKHFRGALAVGQADGSGHRTITSGQTHWFGTPYGSNMPEWSHDGKTVTYTRLQENSAADISAGGAQICLLNPDTGEIQELTPAVEGVWDYRATWAPDGSSIAFCRVRSGSSRELWIMNPDGTGQQKLTDGYQDKGADHYRWLKIRRGLLR